MRRLDNNPRKHFLISLMLGLCVLALQICLNYPQKSVSMGNLLAPFHVFKNIHIRPTWEMEQIDRSEHSKTLWSYLGLDSHRTVILRVYRAQSDISSNENPIEENIPNDSRRLQDDVSSVADELSVSVAFEDIYKTIIFITLAWALGRLSMRLGMPSLVGEIICGFLLGPPLADFVPFPKAMVLIGNFGLIGLILESGIDLDVAQLTETGTRAVIMAITGTSLPLVVGLALGLAAGEDLKSAIAIGAVFSPSSLGVSANVLSAGEVLNTPTGQMIVASSVVDDVLGLILLSILEVFVMDDPKMIDYFLPFISSFSYLLVLGYSSVTWMPSVIEQRILAKFQEHHRELVAYCLMFALLLVYLPLMNYSRASFLTGAFLAGLPFSQIHTIHASFARNGRQVLDWLLRIFFSATIGFQVPVRYFRNKYALRWGVKFLAPVLAKIPLGLYVPRFKHAPLPDDFPYDPYWRDVLITSLAVVCRGEFNFIIASFALGAGLVEPNMYAAVVFASLSASIVGPLVLARVIAYYNIQSKRYLTGNHPIQVDGDQNTSVRPLFLAIQASTPIHWGLQEQFKKAVEKSGLIIIDHRSWHTLGLDAVDITELFVQDTKVKVRVQALFDLPPKKILSDEDIMEVTDSADPSKDNSDVHTMDSSDLEEAAEEREKIRDRCEEIQKILEQTLQCDPKDYKIQVTEWKVSVYSDNNDCDGKPPSQFFCFGTSNNDLRSQIIPNKMSDADDNISHDHSPPATPRERLMTPGSVAASVEEPRLTTCDLWDDDRIAHDATRSGFVMVPAAEHGYDVTRCPGGQTTADGDEPPQHRRRASFDAGVLLPQKDIETITIKDRLHGYVRCSPYL